jgi:putative nucleotidyltransferase with HDIG domain
MSHDDQVNASIPQKTIVEGLAPISPAHKPLDGKPEMNYFDELDKARDIHLEAVAVVSDTLNAIRNDRWFSEQRVELLIQNIIASIERNPQALLSLTQIKGLEEYTYSHSINVCFLVTVVAHALGYSENRLFEAALGGMLHDIGKMKVSDSILNKPGKYTEWEFNAMKKHPEHGYELVRYKNKIPDLSKKVIYQHHERFNGNGYPQGLKGEAIDEIALIGAVADVYDALTTNRSYRSAVLPNMAIAMLFEGRDKSYSKKIVERFTKQMGVYPVGSFVKLKTGEMGVVTRVNKDNLLAPILLVLFSKDKKRLAKALEYDLAKMQSLENGADFRIECSLNPKIYRVDVGACIKGYGA